MDITRKSALDFLNNNIYYSNILESAEQLIESKSLSSLNDIHNHHLALLCEDYGYNSDNEIEINIKED